MSRVDIYSILIRNGYELPRSWNGTMEARKDIDTFIKSNIERTDKLNESLALYSDNQWNKLVWRLNDNGHVIK